MHSRAHLLIEKQFRQLSEEKPWGIKASPVHDMSMFEWSIKIHALQGTLWEGAVFQVYLKFDEHYNYRPPYIQFNTIPFHPNIHPETGIPCMDFLDSTELWNPDYSITMILLTVQALISNPVWTNAVNETAMELFKTSPTSFRQLVFECVKNSSEKEAYEEFGGPVKARERVSLVNKRRAVQEKASGPPTAQAKPTKLSFEDYYVTWCGIATSKSSVEMQNALLEKIRDNPVLQRIHIGLPEAEIEEQINKQIKEHEVTVYGRMFSKNSALEEKAAKMAKLRKMKKIYLPPRASPVQGTAQEANPGADAGLPGLPGKEDTWEREVDDLVAWTKNLDSAAIDA